MGDIRRRELNRTSHHNMYVRMHLTVLTIGKCFWHSENERSTDRADSVSVCISIALDPPILSLGCGVGKQEEEEEEEEEEGWEVWSVLCCCRTVTQSAKRLSASTVRGDRVASCSFSFSLSFSLSLSLSLSSSNSLSFTPPL